MNHSMLQFDLSDRLRKSMTVAGLSVQDMADYMDASRNTVSRWINGAREPKLSTLRLWAMRTGVPLEWIVSGEITEKSPSPSGDGLPIESLHTESNRRPFHYNEDTSNVHELRPARRELAASA